MPKKLLTLMSLILTFMIFPGDELRACSCVSSPPPSEEFENSDGVFVATVTSFKRAKEYSRVAKLRLIKLWKGKKVDEIFTSLNSGLCGFDFVVGETYLIYAFMIEDGELHTNICTRTASLEQAGEDLAFLEQKDPFFTREDSGCCGSVSGSDAILAGGVFLFLFLRRNKTYSI